MGAVWRARDELPKRDEHASCYALYWSTPVSDWTAYYHYFQAFAATFQPASVDRAG